MTRSSFWALQSLHPSPPLTPPFNPHLHPSRSAEFAFDLAVPYTKLGSPGSFRLIKRAGIKVDYKF